MPINWNILGGLNPNTTQTVATQQAPSGLDSLAGGVMQGVQAGQQIQLNNQQAQSNAINLQQAKQVQADQQQLRGAQNEDQYLAALKSQGQYEKAIQYQTAKQNYADSVLNGKKSAQDLTRGEVELAEVKLHAGSALAAQVESLPPEQRAGYWAKASEQLNKNYPSLKLPKDYDQSTSLAMIQTAMPLVNQLQSNPYVQSLAYPDQARGGMKSAVSNLMSDKNQPTTVKLQNSINQLTAQISAGKANGQDTSRLEQQQSELQKQIDAAGAPKVVNPYDSELAKKDADSAGTARSTRDTITHLMSDATDAKSKLTQIPNFKLGPIVDVLKTNRFDTNVQEVQKLLAEMPFLNKSLVGISQGMKFTQGELDQLNKITGSTASNKGALQWIMDRTLVKGTAENHNLWEREKSVRSNGSTSLYNKWLAENPEPPKELNDPSNIYLHPELIGKKANAGNQAQTAAPVNNTGSTNNGFQEGKIYQDANGNKAKFINGKWEAI